jgi:transposase-like protein
MAETCPACGSDRVHRSARRGWERLLTPLPVHAFRCHKCDHRFYGLAGGSVERIGEAHCPSCGTSELKRSSGRQVHEGLLRKLWRAVRVPAYRCDACRLTFFDLSWPFHRRWARGIASLGNESGTPSAHNAP